MASTTSYKNEWARYVLRKKLYKDWELLQDKVNTTDPRIIGAADPIAGLAEYTKDFTGGGLTPEQPGKFSVGIIGAGVAGLFTGLLLDWLNEKAGLNIDYEIHEAASEERLGGRLYTHNFKKEENRPHDYYDVGAMRFPENDIMDRTFRLFDMLGIQKGTVEERKTREDPPVLVPYYMEDTLDVCPAYFNDVRTVGRIYEKEGVVDPYHLNSDSLPLEDRIPEALLNIDPAKLFSTAIEPFIEKFHELNKARAARKPPLQPGEVDPFWKFLMHSDRMSTRQFLLSGVNPDPIPHGPEFNYNTSQWLETATYGTGWYDQSLSEAVLEELDFNSKTWYCVDGGAQKIAKLMKSKLKKENAVKFNSQVVAMDANIITNKPRGSEEFTLTVQDNSTKERIRTKKNYFTVLNSATLGATGRMDLSKAGLHWDTKQAIRCLGYGASCKVGIRFKKPWWRLAPFDITRGSLSRSDLPLQVCVYPSYNIEDPKDEPAVLLVSYTWGQEAQRLASLISSETPKGEEELKTLLLHNLALLHSSKSSPYEDTLKLITNEYDTHHAYDWYRDPQMAGAFAYFGPSQFRDLYPAITKPNAFGQLYFIGEAASAHHAWVVGALESVIRAVYLMVELLHLGNKDYEPYQTAMKLLTTDGPEKLPFYPLPHEMPERQLYTKRGTKQSDHPQEGDGPLNFPAAVTALCLVESIFELTDLFLEISKGT